MLYVTATSTVDFYIQICNLAKSADHWASHLFLELFRRDGEIINHVIIFSVNNNAVKFKSVKSVRVMFEVWFITIQDKGGTVRKQPASAVVYVRSISLIVVHMQCLSLLHNVTNRKKADDQRQLSDPTGVVSRKSRSQDAGCVRSGVGEHSVLWRVLRVKGFFYI